MAAQDADAGFEERLAERSRVETLREGVGRQAPRAMPESVLVLFSYAWQSSKAQHRAQLDLFERVANIVNYKPPEYRSLPRIDLWRDEKRLEKSHGAYAQIEEACERAFLTLVMMSRKYPDSHGCMMEFDKFVDANGENLPGKFAIVVPVNCGKDEVDKRFSAGLRLWKDCGGRTVIQSMRLSEAAKDAFAAEIATEIWRAAERHLGGAAAPPTDKPPPAAEDIAESISRRTIAFALEKFVAPRARTGFTSAEAEQKEGAADAETDGADILKHLTEWAESRQGPRMTAVLGDFGMGKTVTCQMLTQRLLERRRGDPGRTPLPIYLDLREIGDVKATSEGDLETLMAQMLRRTGETSLNPKEVIGYARENGALMIFDGLDEVTNKLSSAAAGILFRTILRIVPDDDWAADRAYRLRRKAGDTKAEAPRKGPLLLVSCRTHYFSDLAAQRAFLIDRDRAGLDANEDIKIWFMLPFNRPQIESYLKQTLGEDDGARALEMIAETYNLDDLSRRPILLRFFSETFSVLEQEKLKGVTIDITKLYDTFIDQALARDDPKHVIPKLEKKLLLGELAYHFHVARLNECPNAELDSWLAGIIESEPALRKLRWGANPIDPLTQFGLFLQDLRNASLLVRSDESSFRFGHTSIREFFLAEALHRKAREGRLEILGENAPSDETFKFIAARQFAKSKSREGEQFRVQIARLLALGQSKELRIFALVVIAMSKATTQGDLVWPRLADLSGIEFSGAHFSSKVSGLTGPMPIPPAALWREADLRDAVFEDISLKGHDFSGALTAGSLWIDCDFSGAITADMDLSGAELRRCRSQEPLQASTALATGVACLGALEGLNLRTRLKGTPASRFATPKNLVSNVEVGGRPAFAVATDHATIRVIDASSGRLLLLLRGHRASVTCLARAGEHQVVSGSGDGSVKLWDTETGRYSEIVECSSDAVESLSVLHLNGKNMILVSTQQLVSIIDFESLSILKRTENISSYASNIFHYTIGDSLKVVSIRYPTIQLLDVDSGAIQWEIGPHNEPVRSACAGLYKGRQALFYVGDKPPVHVIDVASGRELRRIDLTSDDGPILAFAADGDRNLLFMAQDKLMSVLDTDTQNVSTDELAWYGSQVTTVIYENRPCLYSFGYLHSIHDTESFKQKRRFHSFRMANWTASIASDAVLQATRAGTEAFVALTHNEISTWEGATGTKLASVIVSDSYFARGVLAPLQTGLAIATGGSKVCLWDPDSGALLRKFEESTADGLAFTHVSGTNALACSSFAGIAILDPETGERIVFLPDRRGSGLVAFDLVGVSVLGVQYSENFRVLEAETGNVLKDLSLGLSYAATFAPLVLDGRILLAVAENNGIIRMFDLDSEKAIAHLDLGDSFLKVAPGADPGSLIGFGQVNGFIDTTSVLALINGSGMARIRRFALNPSYQDSFVETEHDTGTGEVARTVIGSNAWRDFVAVGEGEDGRQTVRPIEDLLI